MPPKSNSKRQREIDTTIKKIYTDDEGRKIDVSRIQRIGRRRPRAIIFMVIAFLALVAAVSWAGYFIFSPGGRFTGSGVKLAFASERRLVAGDTAVVKLSYENRERVPLGTFELTLTIPDGFELVEASPAATDKHRWIIGTVPAGGSGEIVLNGRISAAEGSSLTFQAFSRYIPGNFNSEFQSVGSATLTVEDAVVNLSATLPADALPGDEVAFAVTYENTDDAPIEHAGLRVTPPADFISANQLEAELGTVAPGEKKTVTIKGSFAADALGARAFAVDAGTLKDRRLTVFTRRSDAIEVKTSELKLSVLVNGSATGTPARFGETLRIALNYENVSQSKLKNLQLALVVDAVPVKDGQTPVDFATLETETPGARRGNRITWTRRELGRLAELPGGGEGTIDLAVSLRDAPFSGTDANYRVTVSAEAVIGAVDERTVNRTVKTTPLEFPIVSDATFNAGARYYNDDEVPVGTGPLPPRVGEQTTFRIFWKITNSLHELENLTIAAPLPDGVVWTNRINVSAGQISFDAGSRRVVWTINRMPTSVHELFADFEVAVTPTNAQVGQTITLTDRATFDATDKTVAARLTIGADALDSNLTGDPVASGRGTVTP